jgi:hypothetical protein
MKRPTVASLKKVNAENLAGLGAERLAEILVAAAQTRPELKRRLRMELAAEQGAQHLSPEIDKRLGSLETSRSKVSWRQRPSFVRDLDALRALIVDRLSGLDRPGALARLWAFMELSRRLSSRVRDRDGELAAVFARAAENIGDLLAPGPAPDAAHALVEALARNPAAWAVWLPVLLPRIGPETAAIAQRELQGRPDPTPGLILLIRQLADATGDADAFAATFPEAALKRPAAAAEVASRLLAAGRIAAAGQVLQAAQPAPSSMGHLSLRPKPNEIDDDWETVWIDYLEQSGQAQLAQDARWASFQRTLRIERARDFTRRLSDFEDVEAEGRAFDYAAQHPDFERALTFLMDWPALSEAARMIVARPDDVVVTPDRAELWAAKLRARQPSAAAILLRKAAAVAARRRDFTTSERLTQEADTIDG